MVLWQSLVILSIHYAPLSVNYVYGDYNKFGGLPQDGDVLMGRLLLDITDTVSYWSGSPTGIQRTLINIARAGSRDVDKFAMVALDTAHDLFRQVQLEDFERIFDQPKQSKIVKRSRTYKSITTPLFSMIPHGLAKAYEKHFGDDLFKVVGRRAPKTVGAVMSPPSPSDTLLILDSNWNQNDYLERLTALRRVSHFRVAGFVHDIIPITWPHFVKSKITDTFRSWISQLALVSDVLVTNSKYTSFELDKWLKDNCLYKKPSIPVAFGNEAWANRQRSSEEPMPISVTKKMGHGVILWVGSLDERKNLGVVLQAFGRVCARMKQPPLLAVVGRKGRGSEAHIDYLKKHPLISKHAVWLEGASDALLEQLLHRASLFIHSSWAEGYGLTVDEALVRGVPCFVANSTSLPEVGGSSCEYFDPASSTELADLIEVFFSNANYARTLKERALGHPIKLWTNTIAEIQAAIERP
jgi:glycosyltransferase involved in cell wall biosynthesis